MTPDPDADAAHARLEDLLDSERTFHVSHQLTTLELFLVLNALSRAAHRHVEHDSYELAEMLSKLAGDTIEQAPPVEDAIRTLHEAGDDFTLSVETDAVDIDSPWYLRLLSGVPWAVFLVGAALLNLFFVAQSAVPAEWWLAVGNAAVVGLLGFSLGRYVDHPEAWDG